MKVNIEGLNDLWNDFTTSIRRKKVNLTKVTIYQVKDIQESSDDEKFKNAKTFFVSADGSEGECVEQVPANIADEALRVGYFYKIGRLMYVPTRDIGGRCIGEYFGTSVIDGFSPKEQVRLLAAKMRNTGSIQFISRLPERGFCILEGMKSCSGEDNISAIDVANGLAKRYKNAVFFTDYPEQKSKSPALDFVYSCSLGNVLCASDGTPLILEVSDNACGRKSLRISVVAVANGRRFILKTVEINHRVTETSDSIADTAVEMIESLAGSNLNFDVQEEKICKLCLNLIPKKTKSKFISMLSDTDKKPIESAYDAISSELFNPRNKEHKTYDYDGGRMKYAIAVGSLLLAE